MAFMIECPNCGPRAAWELHYGGPVQPRPADGADRRQWGAYLYDKPNTSGEQAEWWYHRSGCKAWFVVRRDTRTNRALGSSWFVPQEAEGG
jgi:heterotetrameric sarcosine oxidase delta subunit